MRGGPRSRLSPAAALLWLAVLGNGAAVLWLWLHGGGISLARENLGGLLTSLGRVTALVGTYLVLVQILLLARIPWLERHVGFDRLTVWHRRNGKLAITLVVAHVPLVVAGYALTDQISLGSEISSMFSTYSGMVTATIGTVALIVVVLTSLQIARRRLRYEAWYAVHLSVYAGILLTWFHEVPAGNEFSANHSQRLYWDALYAIAVGLFAWFRLAAPAIHLARYRLRVAEVRRESPHVVSVYIEGRRLERLGAHGGQFFQWRFLSRGRWWQAHPFSLSAAPDGRRLRITVKDVGDFTSGLAGLTPGTSVIAEGPLGTFTAQRARGRAVALIAGGIGITPLRAMLDEHLAGGGPVTLIHRVLRDEDLVLSGELAAYADAGTAQIVNVVGDHRDSELMSAHHLRNLIPDLAQRDVFLCGPPAMMDRVRADLATVGVPKSQIHSERFALAE